MELLPRREKSTHAQSARPVAGASGMGRTLFLAGGRVGARGMGPIPSHAGGAYVCSGEARAVRCRVAGESLRLPAGLGPQALRRNPRLDTLLKHYAAYSLRSAKQLIACNALHPVEERLCRWLLMTHDRAGADSFPLTQEFMAEMLGVRRQTVT